MVLGTGIQLFDISDDATVQKLAQLLVFAPEKLEEDGQHGSGWHIVFATHDLQTSHKGHSDLWVQDRVVLLQQVDHLLRQEACQLLLVDSRDVGHELQVVDHLLVLLARISLELPELVDKDVEMRFELFLVLVWLPLYPVL